MKEKDIKYWQERGNKNAKKLSEPIDSDNYQGDVPVEDILAEASSNAKGINRRDFLKTLGFSTAAVSLAACNKAPVRKAVSFLTKPEEITPGLADYYATYSPDGYSVLVKTIEGRPIKIEGNPDCPLAAGGVGVHGQASVLSLYDDSQLKSPIVEDLDTNWQALDVYVSHKLNDLVKKNKEIALITHTIYSPTEKAVINDFIKKYPTTRHILYDSISYSGILNANKNTFGEAFIPTYRFDEANIVVSFNADFLNTWIDPVVFTKQYSRRKKASFKNPFKHIQLESIMSLTGSNADLRIPIKPSQEGILLIALYNEIAKIKGSAIYNVTTPKKYKNIIRNIAKELLANKNNSLVIAGQNDVSIQTIVNNINYLIGSYDWGRVIDTNKVFNRYKGNETDFFNFLDRANKGTIGAAIFHGVNPVYTLKCQRGTKNFNIEQYLAKIPLKIALSDRFDETSNLCDVIALTPHYLSCWGDAEPYTNTYMLQQPAIAPIYNARQAQASLLTWAGNKTEYYDYLKAYWDKNLGTLTPDVISKGYWDMYSEGDKKKSLKINSDASLAAFNLISQKQNIDSSKSELVLYQNTAMGDGSNSQPNNPMLQELPDPLSKITWNNYIAISPIYAKKLALKEGNIVQVSTEHCSLDLPVAIQPGQANGVVAIAVGYGRANVGHVGNGVGKNAYTLAKIENGTIKYSNLVTIKKLSGNYVFAKSQTEMSAHGRDIIRETTLNKYLKDPKSGNVSHMNFAAISEKDENGNIKLNSQNRPQLDSLWSEHERKGLHWGMAIDLSLCTGCSACVISCNIENNVAVVGEDEVRRKRDMHWIRIDRYYSDTKRTSEDYIDGEDNVEVVYQPMMCQHCDHAPCETVCPVLATMHSSEGLNQMVYNRCFGTRYCANNCPYKVRRFNWFNYADNDSFDYHMNNDLGKLVLNPEVTVRSRGVMEKCSLCVQRIQAGKLKAKLENRPIKDGDIHTACSQSCPTNAIVFGDINDPSSKVHKLLKDSRTYYVLEELNVQPGMGYLTKIRNKVK